MSTLDPTLPAREADVGASTLPPLFNEVCEELGTSDTSLEEMILEMRRIRESSGHEGEA